MKRISAIALLSLASLLTAGSAMAADRAQATIPFAFNVGDMVLPAGDYTISDAGWRPSGVIEIRSADAKHATLTTAISDDKKPVKGGELVFNHYGDKYFLTEVLCPAGGMSVKLPTSKLERKAQINEAALPTTTQILVATK
jgi:hypothetical protein